MSTLFDLGPDPQGDWWYCAHCDAYHPQDGPPPCKNRPTHEQCCPADYGHYCPDCEAEHAAAEDWEEFGRYLDSVAGRRYLETREQELMCESGWYDDLCREIDPHFNWRLA